MEVQRNGPGALVGYLLAGYPGQAEFLHLLVQCEGTAVDVWEIGFPSPDPYGDGAVIREAHANVHQAQARDISYWREIRKATSKPIWLMAYQQDFIDTGLYQRFASEYLMDAMVIPDCDMARRENLRQEMASYGIQVLGFLNASMSLRDVDVVLRAYGLIYAQLYVGQTGASDVTDDAHALARIIASYPQVKIYGGFGVKTPERVGELIAMGFDGAIIGTEIIQRLRHSPEALLQYLREF